MASNLLNTLEKIERGRKKCIQLANEVNYPLPEDASLEEIAQCINAQGYADEYYDSYKAWFSKDFSALPDGKVRLPDEIETLGSKAFYYAENIDIIWPRQLKTIGQYAFYHATFKDGVCEIPNHVTELGAYSFYECLGQTFTVPNSVTNMGNNAFNHSSGTMYYDGRVSVLNSGVFGNSNAGATGNGLKIHMTPESISCIEKINYNAFGQCQMYQLPWHDGVTFTGTDVFKNTIWNVPCVLDKNVYYTYNGVDKISSNMFYGSHFKEGFEWTECEVSTMDNYAFQNTRFNQDIVKIPESITTLGMSTFSGVRRLTDETHTSQYIDRFEFLSKELFDTSAGQSVYDSYYNNFIIHAKEVKMGHTMFKMSSTSTACGSVIFLNITKVPDIQSSVFNSSNLTKGNAYVYVPDDLVAEAKAKQYWSNISARIKPLSEWPLYSEYTEHILPREEV